MPEIFEESVGGGVVECCKCFGGCLAGHESGQDARGYDVVALSMARASPASAIVSTGCTPLRSSPMFGPVPSNLVLLNDLGKCASGTKVRFLGW